VKTKSEKWDFCYWILETVCSA